MATCALCDKPIEEGEDSKEHLILNAIGGRRKVSGVLCGKCNSSAGEEWDAELASQLNHLSLLFGISRERGEVPSQAVKTTGGEALVLHNDGSLSPAKPSYDEKPVGEAAVQVQIVARSMAEAKRMLQGVKRKYPKVDLEDLVKNAQQHSVYPKDALHFPLSFGGPLAGRAIVKSALCMAVANGVDPTLCTLARTYLREDAAEACFGFFYERDILTIRPVRVPLHCVAVSNRGTDGQLLGYAEFFGVQRNVVCLADSYSGPDVHAAYAIDPLSSTALTVQFDLSLTKEEVKATFAYEKIPPGAVEGVFNGILPVALENAYEREKDRVLSNAVEYAFANCGAAEGELLTREHVSKVSRLIMEKLEPFLLHQLTKTAERRRR